MVKNPYTCPRCGHETDKKQGMERHFQRKKPCANNKNLVITPEIVNIVLHDHIYHPPIETQTTQTTQTQTQTNKEYSGYIPKKIKDLVWDTYIGSEIAKSKCLVCKDKEITMREFFCGHVIPRSKGGPVEVNNLRPICFCCNTSMKNRSMIEFCQTHGFGPV